MRQRLAALVAVALLVGGCGFDKGTIEAGGRVNGPNLTIYSSLPQPGHGVSRDMVDAEKLAIAEAGGRVGDFGINFVSIGEGPPDRDAPPKAAGMAASQVIRDPQVIAAYLGAGSQLPAAAAGPGPTGTPSTVPADDPG